jgi:sugar phosphate isomerase/epimerase
MRISLNTLSLEQWSIDEIIGTALKFGFAGIEMREGSVDFSFKDYPSEKRKEVAKKLEDAGLVMTNISSSICLLGAPGEHEKLCDELEGTVKMAADYNAKGIRVFLGNFSDRLDIPSNPVNYEQILKSLDYACELAGSYGVEIWIENHNEFATGRVLRLLIDQLGRKNCKAIWDVLHTLECNESVSESFGFLGPVCAHVHLKDGMPFDNPIYKRWKYCMYGEGIVPFREIFNILKNWNYEGFLSMEWERQWKPELMGEGYEAETAIAKYVETFNRMNRISL